MTQASSVHTEPDENCVPPTFGGYSQRTKQRPYAVRSSAAFAIPERIQIKQENWTNRTESQNGTQRSRGSALMPMLGETSKRAFDIIFAVALLVLLAPLMLFIAAFVRLTSPGSAIFSHSRIGKDGVVFPCLKFRTMVTDADRRLAELLDNDEQARAEWERDQKLRNDPRITPIGRFLRSSSLDELPQLINILLGHMSVVGPRPIVEDEAQRYGVHFADYCAVRPGLTGPWQIGGRNDVSYQERVKLDVMYVRNRSFAYDIVICLKTVPALATSRGCY